MVVSVIQRTARAPAVRPSASRKRPEGPDDGERERRAVVAQLLQALAKRRVLAVAIARFEIGKAFEDAHAGIVRRTVVGETQEAHQGDGRAIEVGAGPIPSAGASGTSALPVGCVVVPHHDDAGVGAEHALGAREIVLHALLVLPRGSAWPRRARRRKSEGPREGRRARTRRCLRRAGRCGWVRVQVHMRVRRGRISAVGAPCTGAAPVNQMVGQPVNGRLNRLISTRQFLPSPERRRRQPAALEAQTFGKQGFRLRNEFDVPAGPARCNP